MKPLPVGLAILVGLVFSSSVSAQPKRPELDPPPSDRGPIVTIRGCVQGTLFMATDLTVLGPTDLFRVVGDGELLEELLEHSGHEVDIIGKLADQIGPTERTGEELRIGERTRVQIGVTKSPAVVTDPFPSPRQSPTDLLELEMRAVTHVDTRCSVDWGPDRR